MIIRMRTTLIIDDEVLHRAKRQAAERNMTLGDLVSEALRASLKRAVVVAPPFSMLTYGNPAIPEHHEPAEFAAALEEDDAEGLSG
jgi:hypothetical protein